MKIPSEPILKPRTLVEAAKAWATISRELRFATPEVEVSTKRKTAVAKKWIFMD